MRPLKRILFALLFVLQMPIYVLVCAYAVIFELVGGAVIYWIITGENWHDTKYGDNMGMWGKYMDLICSIHNKMK